MARCDGKHVPDLIGRVLLVEYSGRHELSHVPVAAEVDGSTS